MNDTDNKAHILIIDDEPVVRNLLTEVLCEKHICTTADSAEKALELLRTEKFSLILSDISMGGMSGLEMIPRVHSSAPDAVIIMISGQQTIDSAIEAMRLGAFDYIKKPFELEQIEIAVRRALEHQSLLLAKRRYENNLEELVRQRTEQLNYLAYHDVLTDLPNRTLFEDRLSQALVMADANRQIAVLFLSLDRFKEIQATIGHAAGSEILRETARRLKNCLPDTATVARFEGDEFALLLPQIGTEDVIEITGNIFEALKLPVSAGDHEIFITAGIGISLFPNDGEDAQSLLKKADAALSRAKEQGGKSYQFYTDGMDARAVQRLTLENDLRRALERNEFEVFYQPKINLSTQKVLGMEALLRWRHPESGLISPTEFIPLAEETGLIVPIGEWILRTACAQTKLWHDQGFKLQVAVNLSARQFAQPNLAENIIGILGETGFNPRFLNLEVTESSIMKNSEAVVKTLAELKNTGIEISIDDFGTGYSSLGYLKHLPIDTLKIDKSFINEVTTNPNDAALVMAIVSLAHNLRLKVVAEGVETEDQLKFLHLLRCDEWQGFFFSQPVSASDFRKILD